jgi:hypothetical protein
MLVLLALVGQVEEELVAVVVLEQTAQQIRAVAVVALVLVLRALLFLALAVLALSLSNIQTL